MKTIIITLLLSISAFTQTYISERLVTSYHVESIAARHTQVAREFINEKLRDFDCLQIELNESVTKEVKLRFFSNNIPGEYQLDLNTKCYNSDLTRVRFAIDGFGYDEDYTAIDLEVTVKGKKHFFQTCGYGSDREARKCPASYKNMKREFSSKI